MNRTFTESSNPTSFDVRIAATLLEKRDFAGVVRYVDIHRPVIEQRADAESGILMRMAASAYSALADLTAALKAARMAQHFLTQNGETAELAEVFFVLGNIFKKSDKPKEAEQAFRDAESLFRRLDLLEGQARALNSLAGIYFKQHDLKNALNVLADALEIAHKLNDTAKIALMTGNIGRIHLFSGNLQSAKAHLRTNIELSRALRDHAETARALMSYAYACIQSGHYAEADATLSEAVTPLRLSGDKRDEVMYYSYIGELRRRMGLLEESKQVLAHALRLSEQVLPDSGLTARVMRQLAETNLSLRDYRTARQLAQKAIVVMQETPNTGDLAGLHRILAMIAEAETQQETAKEFWARAIESARQSGVRFEEAEILYFAGCATAIPVNKRVLHLIRAEEYYAQSGHTTMIDKIGEALEQTNQRKIAGSDQSKQQSADFITRCAAVERVKQQIVLIGSRSNLPVLLTGETGVGKDQMARFFHSKVRPGTPFVSINCAGVPDSLLESELFGYRRGAFTDAREDKAGLFVAANGGVLFLDEIGDMPLHLQAKLLGVLERREVTPLGGTVPVKLDINLICATNRDLTSLVEGGLFRRDLYFRICDGDIHYIPALRERKEDIPLLLDLFITNGTLGQRGFKVSAELLQTFLAYHWPGNVRELYNKVKRLEAQAEELGNGDLVELARPMFTNTTAVQSTTFFDRIEQFERQLLTDALLAAKGNKSEAARLLGIHEATVRSKIKRYQIHVEGVALH